MTSRIWTNGKQGMRKIYKSGIELHEKRLLSEYTHRDEQCQTVKRGKLDFTLATAIGKVKFPRQRLFCKTCREWVTPLNEALGLHDEEKERNSVALQQLSSLYALCTINRHIGDFCET